MNILLEVIGAVIQLAQALIDWARSKKNKRALKNGHITQSKIGGLDEVPLSTYKELKTPEISGLKSSKKKNGRSSVLFSKKAVLTSGYKVRVENGYRKSENVLKPKRNSVFRPIKPKKKKNSKVTLPAKSKSKSKKKSSKFKKKRTAKKPHIPLNNGSPVSDNSQTKTLSIAPLNRKLNMMRLNSPSLTPTAVRFKKHGNRLSVSMRRGSFRLGQKPIPSPVMKGSSKKKASRFATVSNQAELLRKFGVSSAKKSDPKIVVKGP